MFGISLLLPLLPAAITWAAEVEVPRAFDAIGVGSSTSCAIDTDGDLRCWGDGSMGALGSGSTATIGSGSGTAMTDLEPVVIPAMDPSARFVAVDGGVQFTCALDDLGSVWCWGRNEVGQLGLDSDEFSIHPGSIPAPVDLGAAAMSISVGPYHSCAVLTGGAVRCWGLDQGGSLGVGRAGQEIGSAANPMASVDPVDLGAGSIAVSVSAGGQHTCALLDDATLRCWGANSFGQLGLGDTVSRGRTADSMGDALPAVDLPSGVVSVAAGGEHTCAVLDDGALHCWGLNDFGQLGLGDISNRGDSADEMGLTTEVDLGGDAVARVATGSAMSCALLSDGEVTCWGNNTEGELGTGDLIDLGDHPTETPILDRVSLPTDRTVIDLAVGPHDLRVHVCAHLDDATMSCWGGNAKGQLGLDSTEAIGDEAGEMGDSLARVALTVTETVPDPAPDPTPDPAPSPAPAPPASGGSGSGSSGGSSGGLSAAPALTPAPSVDTFIPLGPTRVHDTRTGLGSLRTQDIGIASEGVHRMSIDPALLSGISPIALALNVTVTDAESAGYATVFGCGERPDTSNLNFSPGSAVANAAITPVISPDDPGFCVYLSAPAHVLVDLVGAFPEGGDFSPINPMRLADTRAVGTRIGMPAGDGADLVVAVTGLGGVASGASSAILNVTVTEVLAEGFATVYPCGARPNASNLNFTIGSTVPNLVVAPLDAEGRVCVHVTGQAHVIVDVMGWFADGSDLETRAPIRVLDTRNGSRVGPDGELWLRLAGAEGVPTGVRAVAMNLTATSTSGAGGYVTLFPCGPRPDTSSLNFSAAPTVANAVIAPVSPEGLICFHVIGEAHLIADVSGWIR